MATLKQSIFNNLIEHKVFDKGNGITNFGFECNYTCYNLSFYIDDNTGNKVIVDSCGHKTSKGWCNLDLTTTQIETLQSIIDETINTWENDDESFEPPIGNPYDYYGVRTKFLE